MSLLKMVKGEAVEMTPEEVADFEASRAPSPPTPDELVAYAAAKRWEVENGGMELPDGTRVHTDRESRSNMETLISYLKKKPAGTSKRFKGPDGWSGVDVATLEALGVVIGDFVTAAFAREEEVAEAITAGTVTTTEEIDAAFADVAAPWTAEE